MSKKKIGIVISVRVVFFVAVALALTFFVLSMVSKHQKIDYYEIGEARVPSIKLVVGKKKLKSVSSSTNNEIIAKKYGYQSEVTQADVLTYGEKLINEGGIISINIDSISFNDMITILKGVNGIEVYDSLYSKVLL